MASTVCGLGSWALPRLPVGRLSALPCRQAAGAREVCPRCSTAGDGAPPSHPRAAGCLQPGPGPSPEGGGRGGGSWASRPGTLHGCPQLQRAWCGGRHLGGTASPAPEDRVRNTQPRPRVASRGQLLGQRRRPEGGGGERSLTHSAQPPPDSGPAAPLHTADPLEAVVRPSDSAGQVCGGRIAGAPATLLLVLGPCCENHSLRRKEATFLFFC